MKPESKTDFWEIPVVLLRAGWLPFPFRYFHMRSASRPPHRFLYRIPFSPDELLIFCLPHGVISKYFFLKHVRCKRSNLCAVRIKSTAFHPWETVVILSEKIRWIRLDLFLVIFLYNIYSSLYSSQFVFTYFPSKFVPKLCLLLRTTLSISNFTFLCSFFKV